MKYTPILIAMFAMNSPANPVFAASNTCAAQSAATRTPVVELYTSEGCSSCPSADQWASTLKPAAAQGSVVVQAFHVNYWDYIGWTDRFAAPAHTARQRQISAANGLSGIYTPQLVKNGQTTKDYERPTAFDGGPATPAAASSATASPALASIAVQQIDASSYRASITPLAPNAAWSAYFTVTEHGHSSRVTAGENKGEQLVHDFVVRQYVPLGSYTGAQKLSINPLPADAKHPRQINLVVTDSKTGKALQALSVGC